MWIESNMPGPHQVITQVTLISCKDCRLIFWLDSATTALPLTSNRMFSLKIVQNIKVKQLTLMCALHSELGWAVVSLTGTSFCG